MTKALAFVVIAVFMFASCGCEDGNSSRIYGREVDSVVVDTVIPLVSGEKHPNCELHLALRFFPSLPELNDSILSMGMIQPEYLPGAYNKADKKQLLNAILKKCISSYRQQFAPIFLRDKTNANEYNYSYKVYTETWPGIDSTVCYLAHTLIKEGDHQQLQSFVKNFDLRTCSTITADDIFVPGYERALIRLIEKKLMKTFKANNENELKEKKIFVNCDPYIPDNVMLLKHKIIFIYGQDEIASHDYGEIKIEFSRKELKDLLKKR